MNVPVKNMFVDYYHRLPNAIVLGGCFSKHISLQLFLMLQQCTVNGVTAHPWKSAHNPWLRTTGGLCEGPSPSVFPCIKTKCNTHTEGVGR